MYNFDNDKFNEYIQKATEEIGITVNPISQEWCHLHKANLAEILLYALYLYGENHNEY